MMVVVMGMLVFMVMRMLVLMLVLMLVFVVMRMLLVFMVMRVGMAMRVAVTALALLIPAFTHLGIVTMAFALDEDLVEQDNRQVGGAKHQGCHL